MQARGLGRGLVVAIGAVARDARAPQHERDRLRDVSLDLDGRGMIRHRQDSNVAHGRALADARNDLAVDRCNGRNLALGVAFVALLVRRLDVDDDEVVVVERLNRTLGLSRVVVVRATSEYGYL